MRNGPHRRSPFRRGPRAAWIWGLVTGLPLVALAGWLGVQVGMRRAATAAAVVDAGQEMETIAPDDGEDLGAAIESDEPEPVAVRERFGPEDPFGQIDVHLRAGETLFDALLRGGLARHEAAAAIAALKPHLDFRTLRAGDRFTGDTWLNLEIISGTFQRGRSERYRLMRGPQGLVAVHEPVVYRTVTEVVSGEVESSLFAAIQRAGERPQLIMNFADMFRWDFDFNTQTRSGDQFRMLVEKRFLDDAFYDYGPILAGRYESGGTRIEACYFRPAGADGGWYHVDGSSVRRAFLRAPVKFSRISSRYSLSRLHPTLGIRRPHRGIDYAAPQGTPVLAVGDGVVVGAGWMGGAGNAVQIRHANGWTTSYSHLSKIKVRRGQRVTQGQVIGLVGSTGHSTGPHLDYRIKIGGRFVNPLGIKFPSGEPIPSAHRAEFDMQCSERLAQLDHPPVQVAASGRPAAN